MDVRSEIRAVFIHEEVWGYPHDWNVIAETLAQYGVQAVFVNDLCGVSYRSIPELSGAIEAFHSRGIEYHSSINAIGESKDESGELCAITSAGEVYSLYQLCPIKAHDTVLNTITEYLTQLDVDGLMFDYIRYSDGTTDMCYCPQCRAAFEAWLGEGPITDWTVFYPDAAQWLKYAEWRTIPITDLVRDMRLAALTVNPNLEFSLAAWTYFQNCPIYWRKFIGQDTGKWIKEGYLDFVAPMMYTQSLTELRDIINSNLQYMTAGSEGIIPFAAFLDASRGITPQGFKDEVDLIRSVGLDGWILWRYGGPGIDSGGALVDVTAHLATLDLPPTFTLTNIEVSRIPTQAVVNWSTSLPATSRVEYATKPLFWSVFEPWGDFYSWNAKHDLGTVLEDPAFVTEHQIVIDGLSPGVNYYVRVQSENSSGVASSEPTELKSLLTFPFDIEIDEATYKLTVPSNVLLDGQTWNLQAWLDPVTDEPISSNPVRIVNLTQDILVKVKYELLVLTAIQIHAFYKGEEINAEGLIVETSTVFMTPATVEVPAGAYTVQLTYLSQTKISSVEVAEGQTVRIDEQFLGPTPIPPLAVAALIGIPVAGLILWVALKR